MVENETYVINTAEKTGRSATEQETKTMLYLMGYMDDSKNIDTFIIDTFNDVTAVNGDNTFYWDAQSKGDSSSSPNAIGKELDTLFKNYVSVFHFDYYILSLRKVSEKNIIDTKKPLSSVSVLKFSDFTKEARDNIKKSLIEECNEKTYISKGDDFLEQITSFLDIVHIIVNNDENVEYIKKISFMNNELINDSVINDIFETIRAKQVAIKTSININGIKLQKIEDGLNLNRNLSVKSINSLILGKILGHDIISKNNKALFIPLYFNEYVNKYSLDIDTTAEIINDAVNGIYLMLINENLNKEFWALIYSILEECDKEILTAYQVYENLLKNHSHLLYLYKAKEEEMIYLIACVLGGKKSEDK